MLPAIRCENLGKMYLVDRSVGQGPGHYRTLRESLAAGVSARLARLRGTRPACRAEEFWALRDVSFDVQPGEVIGILGRNGAGKSTLLKILSRITRPSTGRATICGRVGSLLEVGTGFHPELTGRENIYLNGAILGMTRREIAQKFDEIVDFAGVEKFLETPVKRFSSGMYVRLAFAVASSLEPEVLLVDEVLAVGDQEFQKKCLNKMDNVANSGRTIFFVSHQLAAVEALCSRVLVLDRGALVMDGDAGTAIGYYLARLREAADCPLAERKDRGGSGGARLTALRVCDERGRATEHVPCGARMVLEADVECPQRLPSLDCAFIIVTARGQRLFRLYTGDGPGSAPPIRGQATYRCTVDALNLMPGPYSIHARLFGGGEELLDDVEMAGKFNVAAGDVTGAGRVPGTRHDLVVMPCSWSFPAAVTEHSCDAAEID